MDKRTKEAIRYLGYGKHTVDNNTMQMIENCFNTLDQIAVPVNTWCDYEVCFSEGNQIQIGPLHIQSKDLYRNLNGCQKAVVFSATLGIEVDRQIRRYECVHIAQAVVMQACAAAYFEEYCDRIQENIANQMKMEGLSLRPRFSPGYGDFSILHQKDILHVLDAAKKIGLTMTEGYMLTPTKSITAIIGVCK